MRKVEIGFRDNSQKEFYLSEREYEILNELITAPRALLALEKKFGESETKEALDKLIAYGLVQALTQDSDPHGTGRSFFRYAPDSNMAWINPRRKYWHRNRFDKGSRLSLGE